MAPTPKYNNTKYFLEFYLYLLLLILRLLLEKRSEESYEVRHKKKIEWLKRANNTKQNYKTNIYAV